VPPSITFEQISTFYEIQHRRHAAGHDLDVMPFNPIASTIPKYMCRLLRWMQNLHQSTWGHEIMNADKASIIFNKTTFCKKKKNKIKVEGV
jgi:hypothetical protein